MQSSMFAREGRRLIVAFDVQPMIWRSKAARVAREPGTVGCEDDVEPLHFDLHGTSRVK